LFRFLFSTIFPPMIVLLILTGIAPRLCAGAQVVLSVHPHPHLPVFVIDQTVCGYLRLS
ncbi:Protein RST1, partial [Dissostichus eleginoides]